LPGKAEPVEAVAVEVTVVKRRGEALAPVGRQQLLRRGRDAGLSLSLVTRRMVHSDCRDPSHGKRMMRRSMASLKRWIDL
jgi:hypothetical protein